MAHLLKIKKIQEMSAVVFGMHHKKLIDASLSEPNQHE